MTSLANSDNGVNRYVVVKDLINNDVKYRYFGKISSGLPAYSLLDFNAFNNSLILTGGQLFALDLNKMLTSVDDSLEKSKLFFNYFNGNLTLSGLNANSNKINITISDIKGRLIQNLDIPVSNSELKIPISLSNGTYLIHIQNGDKEYSSKFLVTE